HAPQPARWQVEDRSSPVRYPADHPFVTEVLADNPKVCARIADPSHALVPAGDGYATGNCVPVERSVPRPARPPPAPDRPATGGGPAHRPRTGPASRGPRGAGPVRLNGRR